MVTPSYQQMFEMQFAIQIIRSIFIFFSVWEAIVKYQLGKLPLPEHPETYLPKQRDLHQIVSLSLDESSVAQLAKLPPLHRDPFDRMLICQALQNGMTIATVDGAIRAYSVSVM